MSPATARRAVAVAALAAAGQAHVRSMISSGIVGRERLALVKAAGPGRLPPAAPPPGRTRLAFVLGALHFGQVSTLQRTGALSCCGHLTQVVDSPTAKKNAESGAALLA